MYKERRKALASTLPNTAIALVCSGKAPYKVGDEKYDFSVDRSFYCLTGLDKENMVLAIIKVEGRVSEYLFIERYDEELAKWVGGRIMPKDAANISGIQEIYWREEAMDTIGSVLSRYFSGYANVDVYADFTKQEAEQADSEAHMLHAVYCKDIHTSFYMIWQDTSVHCVWLRMKMNWQNYKKPLR